MIPVDELRAHTIAAVGYEYVFRPEVAVQKRIGPARFLHHPHASGYIVAEAVQPLEQAAPRIDKLGWHVPRKERQCFKGGDRIAQTRHEVVRSVIARTPADLGDERMPRGARVEIGD